MLYNPEFDAPTWQFFLFYEAVNIIFLAHNILFQRRASWIHNVGCKSR